ncbi:hypothetical protein DSL72_002786 [Monilinia vaccinii-corymbosi]|uniref:Uncharacterized protein n=1 Tax=Monilinia vaccinii-corymbosi TaxID=61207 RepID=A0A8A3PDN3_9HELO|nr:hypothetical protein DSL72_002786 [Monilinia vaccinii-corymbosi]
MSNQGYITMNIRHLSPISAPQKGTLKHLLAPSRDKNDESEVTLIAHSTVDPQKIYGKDTIPYPLARTIYDKSIVEDSVHRSTASQAGTIGSSDLPLRLEMWKKFQSNPMATGMFMVLKFNMEKMNDILSQQRTGTWKSVKIPESKLVMKRGNPNEEIRLQDTDSPGLLHGFQLIFGGFGEFDS